MSEKDQLTSEELAQVRELLNQRNTISGVIPQKILELPSGLELVGKYLLKLGKVGQYIVFALKKGVIIVGILMLPVGLGDFIEYYRPKTRVIIEQVAVVIKNMQTSEPMIEVPLDHQISYVGYNAEWMSLPDSVLGTSSSPEGTITTAPPFPFNTTTTPPPDIIISSSNTSYGIVSGSGITRGLG